MRTRSMRERTQTSCEQSVLLYRSEAEQATIPSIARSHAATGKALHRSTRVAELLAKRSDGHAGLPPPQLKQTATVWMGKSRASTDSRTASGKTAHATAQALLRVAKFWPEPAGTGT